MRDSADLREILFLSGSGRDKDKVWVEFKHATLNALYHAVLLDRKTAKEFCSRLMSYFEPEIKDGEYHGELDDFTQEEWNKIAKANRAIVRKAQIKARKSPRPPSDSTWGRTDYAQ